MGPSSPTHASTSAFIQAAPLPPNVTPLRTLGTAVPAPAMDASSSHKAPAKKQVTLAAAFSSVIPYDKKGPRWQAITDAVTHYIAKYMVPIYTVEKNGFIKMLQTIDPKYQLPSRKHFATVALPNLYNKTRARVAEQLQNIVYYSTTTDLWSSRTTHPYLSLTVHFIDGEWALRGMCLQTSYFPDDHTGEN
ncbi:hypothetical protein F7725_004194 [Dissostichus mawsoni]|uniref:Uncharacterized protein n=1 Tax=Dissostichus mawsoni TaxID=36200 RepID=A0A7J5XIC8_DISMA|nr:hypothetical protein F7725_004194 [Dissostichus mawsoni]